MNSQKASIVIKGGLLGSKKPHVLYVDERIRLEVGRGRFFREFFSMPGTEPVYYSSTYNSALIVKKLLRGKEGKAGVEKLKNSGVLTEAMASEILRLGKVSDMDAIGALWDAMESRELKIGVMTANILPVSRERASAFVKSEGIDGCAGWLFLDGESKPPTLNMARAMDALVNLINGEGAKTEGMVANADTVHMFNLPKLALTLCIMDRLGTPNGVSVERLFEIFESLSNTGGYTVRGNMMRALGGKPEIAKIALAVMYKDNTWENAYNLADLLISPRSGIPEAVQIEIANEMADIVNRLQHKYVDAEDKREMQYFHGLEQHLSDFSFQMNILNNKDICSQALLALIDAGYKIEYMKGHAAGYEKGKADAAPERAHPFGIQH